MKKILICPFVVSLALIASEEPPPKKQKLKPSLVIAVPDAKSNKVFRGFSERVVCSICGDEQVIEAITVDDVSYGFCNHHAGYASSRWRNLFSVKEEEKDGTSE